MKSEFGNLKTMVVDDDDFSLVLLKASLKNIGIEDVTCFNSAKEALLLIEDTTVKPFDLIFSDLQMPQMDGEQFAGELDKLDFKGGVILVSGTKENNLHKIHSNIRKLSLNVMQCMKKPVSTTHLSSVLSFFETDLEELGGFAEKNIRVIVVDDEPFVLDLISNQLYKLGVSQVQCAHNVKEATEIIYTDSRSDDLLIMDLFMPDVDGIEFLKYLHGRNYKGNIAIISGVNKTLLKGASRYAKDMNLSIISSNEKPLNLSDLHDILLKHTE